MTSKKFQIKGAALITAMIVLLALTIMSIAMLRQLMTQETLASNTQELITASHASDASLVSAEAWIRQQNTRPTAVSSCSSHPCDVWQNNSFSNLENQTTAWWLTTGRSPEISAGNVNTPPALSGNNVRYVIQEVTFVGDTLDPTANAEGRGIVYYEITAQGLSEDDTRQITQSIFGQRY